MSDTPKFKVGDRIRPRNTYTVASVIADDGQVIIRSPEGTTITGDANWYELIEPAPTGPRLPEKLQIESYDNIWELQEAVRDGIIARKVNEIVAYLQERGESK